MNESIKAVAAFILIVVAIVSAVAWFDDQPGPVIWMWRLGGPTVAMLAILTIVMLEFRPDREPDFLRQIATSYFQEKGFGFLPQMKSLQGVAVLEVHCLNQFERPCEAEIALRPRKKSTAAKAKLPPLRIPVNLDAAEFARVRLPLGLPKKVQGQQLEFDVGVSVIYPDGRGRRLRFHEGIGVRNTANFDKRLLDRLTVPLAFLGMFVWTTPARVTLGIPIDVAEQLSSSASPRFRSLWKLGDPPPEL